MPLTPVTFTLTPNQYDGRQRLSDPAGNEQPPAAALQPVTALAISNTTSNSQTLTWQHDEGDGIEGYGVEIWVTNQDSTWRGVGDVPVGTKTFTSSGLPGGRYVRYRVAAYIADPLQVSAWAEVDGSTLAAPGGGTETNLLAIEWFYNFEHLSPGVTISGRDGFSIAKNTTCNASIQTIAGGTRCGHMFMDTATNNINDGGFGYWGWGRTGIPDALQGCKVWWRTAIYWPTNSYYASSGGLLKQMRFRRHALSDRNNRGSSEVGIDTTEGNRTLKLSLEFIDSWTPDRYGKPTTNYFFDNAQMPFGRWVWWETYMYLHKDPGQGEVAVWIDGDPVGRVTCPTMCRPSDGIDTMDELFFGTYWNGFNGGYSEQYIDQMAFAMDGPVVGGTRSDEQYLAEDSNGYPYIGTASNTDIIR